MSFFGFANRRDIGAGANLISRVVSVASRFRDWKADRRREVRIRDLRTRMSVAFAARDHISVAHLGRLMFAECDARSPRAVARLERRCLAAMDEHMREALGK